MAKTKKERTTKKGTGKARLPAKPLRPPVPSYDPLQQYLAEIRNIPLLTREQEKELAIKFREEGDVESAYKLVVANLRLVVKIAMDFQRHWVQNLMDLIQEGNIGLIQAVKKFDPFRGFKFSYYASFWIKAYIIKFIMDNWKLVKIGTTQAQRKLFFNLAKEKEKLESLGFEPGPKLLSERLNVKESEVIEMEQRLGSWEMSLDAPIGENSKTDLKSFLPAQQLAVDDYLAKEEAKTILKEKLKEFKKTLNQREQYILEERMLAEKPITLQVVGDKYGVSRERVRQLENRLKKRIKAFLESEIDDLDSFHDSFK